METLVNVFNATDLGFDNEVLGKQGIMSFEKFLAKQEGALFGDNDLMPLKHSFAPGVYVREIFIPKGTMLTGKIHRHAHPNFLMSGEVIVITEFEGRQQLKAPMSMISKAGTKRAVLALEDTVWITVHVTNETDLEKIEEYVIAPSYEEFEKGKLALEVKNKNCLILALEKLGRDYSCLLNLPASGYLLNFKDAIKSLAKNDISLDGITAKEHSQGVWHAEVGDGGINSLAINDSDMVGTWGAVAIGGAALVGAGASYLASDAQSSSAQYASNTQLQAQLAALRQQRSLSRQGLALAERQFNLARRDLAPLRELGMRNLRRAEDYTNPNSALSRAERAEFSRSLANNLAARGLTGSGAEIAGLKDFELGLAGQRRDASFNLGNIGVNTLNNLASLRSGFGQLQAGTLSGLGANNANLISQGGVNQANLMLQSGQANASGIAGINNAFQTGLQGYFNQRQQEQQNQLLQSLLQERRVIYA